MSNTTCTAVHDGDDDGDDDHASSSSTAKKRPRRSIGPRTFVTWNCNGFTSRCTYDADLLQKLVQQTDADVYCLQEVRLKAASKTQRGQPLPSEYQGAVERVLNGTFRDYVPYWSLADTKYAGTLTLIRKRLGQPLFQAFSIKAALNMLLNEFSLTAQDCGIADCSSCSTSISPTTTPTPINKQPSIKSFFAAKPPASSSSNLVLNSHDNEGRFQFFRLEEDLDLLQVYVPNHGHRADKWDRRRDWDEALQEFLQARRTIYRCAGVRREPRLLGAGDFNVARTHHDGTHWEQTQRPEEGAAAVYEFWTDEAKCLVFSHQHQQLKNNSNDNTAVHEKHPDYVGMASFTPVERRRFNQMLEQQDWDDVWRTLHPAGAAGAVVDPSLPSTNEGVWDQPNWTWRGHLSKDARQMSKYDGKGQRLDYFLLSPSASVLRDVESCDILGHGRLREGLFCGSDHCAVSLKLKDANMTTAPVVGPAIKQNP